MRSASTRYVQPRRANLGSQAIVFSALVGEIVVRFGEDRPCKSRATQLTGNTLGHADDPARDTHQRSRC